jgi:hypothetical protein
MIPAAAPRIDGSRGFSLHFSAANRSIPRPREPAAVCAALYNGA